MKRVIIIILLSTAAMFSQNVSPQFSELKGMEDQSGNTHLFYRIHTSSYDSVSYWTISSNNIYHLDLFSQADTLFLESYNRLDSIYQNPEDYVIADLTFWQNNPSTFIYVGVTETTILNEHIFIKRFDSENTYNKRGFVDVIEISKLNDSLIYAGVSVFDTSGLELTIKSTDGGWNWVKVPGIYQFLSLNPVNDQVFFARDEISKKLYKTTDGGISFYLVDSSMTYQEQQYHYDPNENHIYRVTRNFFTRDYELKVSTNSGEAFSWATKYISPDQIFISNNVSFSGELYLADGKNIYLSTDYANNFNLYKRLERNIVGIYKKPSSGGPNKLYAATKYKIYEITPDTIQVIKTLPIPEERLSYYPLAVGNKWIYDYQHLVTPVSGYSDIFIRSIVDEVIQDNGEKYFQIEERFIFMGVSNTVYERVDSSTGKIMRFKESCPDSEQAIDDLLGDIGDSLNVSRFGDCLAHPPTIFVSEQSFNQWGINSSKMEFVNNELFTADYFLAGKVGLLSIIYSDDNGDQLYNLNGAIINGIVYGDTTVVSVEDETPNMPTEFSLSQNYPNPFNPSTMIKYAIGSRQYATLKVYDILGNEVATLVNEEKPAGEYEVEFNAKGLPSGIYFYQLSAGNFVETKKMLLIK